MNICCFSVFGNSCSTLLKLSEVLGDTDSGARYTTEGWKG